MKDRIKKNNFKEPSVIYTDRPQVDENFLLPIFPNLSNGASVTESSVADILSLPGDIGSISIGKSGTRIRNGITVITTKDVLQSAVNILLKALDSSSEKYIGLDCEWCKGSKLVGTLQLSLSSGQSWLFHLSEIFNVDRTNPNRPIYVNNSTSNTQCLIDVLMSTNISALFHWKRAETDICHRMVR